MFPQRVPRCCRTRSTALCANRGACGNVQAAGPGLVGARAVVCTRGGEGGGWGLWNARRRSPRRTRAVSGRRGFWLNKRAVGATSGDCAGASGQAWTIMSRQWGSVGGHVAPIPPPLPGYVEGLHRPKGEGGGGRSREGVPGKGGSTALVRASLTRQGAARWVKGCLSPCVPVVWGRFRTARAQRGHSTNYYGDYPGNNPENHAPAESCTINSKLKSSNI